MTFRGRRARFNRLGGETQSCLSACWAVLPRGSAAAACLESLVQGALPLGPVAVPDPSQGGFGCCPGPLPCRQKGMSVLLTALLGLAEPFPGMVSEGVLQLVWTDPQKGTLGDVVEQRTGRITKSRLPYRVRFGRSLAPVRARLREGRLEGLPPPPVS